MAATTDGLPPDPLSLLKKSIALGISPVPTTDPDPSTQAQSNVPVEYATHLIFSLDSPQDGPQHIAIPVSQETRFVSKAYGRAIDLRSVYYVWERKDMFTHEYITTCRNLNEKLKSEGKDYTITQIQLAEKLGLITWLEGQASDAESDFIKSVDDNKAAKVEAKSAARLAAGDGDIEMGDAPMDDAKRRDEEERLRLIYAAERKMGDHNTVLRGVKIQDFSGIRKYSTLFLGKAKNAPNAAQAPTTTLTNNPALRPPVKPASGRRPEPIILLSSSFSSLLRMPNIKTFLAEGIYTPLESSGEAPNILHISRQLRSIHANHPTRFILVDDPSHFRPDYWSRVVAVFTTGQTWQFKNYKWQNPAELFSHALGVYVGWKGEVVPDTVKGWGRQVMSVQIDKGVNRWRDREVVEDIWSQIEARMRAMGWGRDGK